MIEPNVLIAILNNMSSDSNRVTFLKEQHKLFQGGVNKSLVVQMAHLCSDSYKKDIFTFCKPCLKIADVPDLMKVTSSDSYRMDVIKIFAGSYSSTPKETIINIVKTIDSDNYRIDGVKYFKNWFSPSDIVSLMNIISSDNYKIDLIKIFVNDFSGTIQSTVIKIISCIKADNYREDAVKLFKNWFGAGAGDVYTLCSMYTDDSYKMKVINTNNIKNSFNTHDTLSKLLNYFTGDASKFKALEKKIKDGITLVKDMINIIVCFEKEKYRKNACVMFFGADRDNVFDNDCCLSVMSLFPDSLMFTLLTEYRKNHVILPENVIPLIKQLKSKSRAINFLTYGNFSDIESKLQEAGYKNNMSEAENPENEIDSVSESDEEIEEDVSSDDDNSDNDIIEINVGFGQGMKYDRRRDVVVWNGSTMSGGVSINGIDVIAEGKRQARKQAEERKKKKAKKLAAKKKKEMLKVPHAWRDEKAWWTLYTSYIKKEMLKVPHAWRDEKAWWTLYTSYIKKQ